MFKKMIGVMLIIYSVFALALEEQHLVLVAVSQDGSEPRAIVDDITRVMIHFGFDNRSIQAVLGPGDSYTQDIAKQIADIGFFTENKIQVDNRLAIKKVAAGMRQKRAVLQLYDTLQKTYPNGHIMIMADARILATLVEATAKTQVHLKTGQTYLLPLTARNMDNEKSLSG